MSYNYDGGGKIRKYRNSFFLIASFFFILCSIGGVFAEDSNITPENQTALQSVAVTATTDRYVNINSGNDAWDGTSPTYISGTVGPKQHISSGLAVSLNSGNLYIAAGTYKESKLTLTKNLTIIGDGKTNTTIDAAQNNLIFWIKPGVNVTIKNLNLINGIASRNDFSRNGGAIYNEGNLIVDNCRFYNNHGQDADDATWTSTASSAGNGGAIYNTGTLTLKNSEFSNNHAGQGGDASTFYKSSSGGSGGAIYNTGTINNIQECTFTNNYAGRGGASSGTLDGKPGGSGGAIYNTGTINNIQNSTFTTNHAGNGGSTQTGAAANPGTGGNGGAISNDGTINITNCTFDGNYAGNGGQGSDIQNGAHAGYGGTIYNNGIFTISGSEIKNGRTGTGGAGPGAAKDGADGNGGAFSNMKILTITQCEIHHNTANNGNGGGIYNSISASLNLQNSKIHDNSASNGAGIYNENQITIINCENYNNKAATNGGGIWNSANLTLANLTIRNNSAGNTGGGIYNNGVLTLKNFTITQNTAINGGGIGNGNKLTLYDSNITYNTANTHGGGIYNSNLIYMVNSQVEFNTPDNIYGNTKCVVNNRTGELYSTIQDAINKASANDTLLILNGTYLENLTINKNINLIGSSYTNTILDGNQEDRCINIGGAYKVAITDLTITHGLTEGNGGGIWNSGYLFLTNVKISYNECQLPNFKSAKGDVRRGGGIYNTGNLTLTNCNLYKNNAWINNYLTHSEGGGIYNSGNLTVINSTFNGNYIGNGGIEYDGGDGGAIYNTGKLNVTNSTFQSNKANCGSTSGYNVDFNGGHGGAIYNTGQMTGTNNTFVTNHADYLIVTNVDFGKLGGGYGGAIYNRGSINITNNLFHNNTGIYGGAIYNNGNLTDTNNTYTNNNATGKIVLYSNPSIGKTQYSLSGGYGGAIYNYENGNLTIINDTFTDNISAYGGAISDKSKNKTTISNSTFSYNTVQATDENGKEIKYYTMDMTALQITETILAYAQAIVQFTYNFKLFTGSSINIVLQTTADMVKNLNEHTIQATGGAIYMEGSSNLNLDSCTFYNNTAAIGGAIHNSGNGNLTVNNVHLTKNAAGLGGAIYSNNLGSLLVKNSLFDGNIGGNNGAIFFGGTTSNLWAECNITQNIFKNNTAIFGTVFYNGINGTSHSYLNFNQIYGTNCYDVFNEYELNKIDAKYNWWGSNYGPGTYSTYDKFNLNIDTSHFLVLTLNSPTDMTYGENATIMMDMLHDNSGVYQDPKFGVIPDGVKVKLSTDNGNIIPDSVILVKGVATATYFANGSTGPAEIYAVVDNDERYPSIAKIDIQKISTTTRNVYSQYSGAVGSNVTFTARVTDKYNHPVNAGTVTFKVGVLDLIAHVVNGNAVYVWTIPSSMGNSSIYTTYNGDNIYASSNDIYQSQLVVVPSADVVLTLDVLPQITLGEEFTALITAENKGPDMATRLVFSNTIPSSLQFLNASIDRGTWSYDPLSKIFTWNIGDLEIGTAHLYLTLKALEAGTYSLNPILASGTYDPHPDNHNVPLNIQVTDPRDHDVNPIKVVEAHKTVEMEETGLTLSGLILAILAVLGGLASAKRK